MQHTNIFEVIKNENFLQKNIDIFFFIFVQNIDLGAR